MNTGRSAYRGAGYEVFKTVLSTGAPKLSQELTASFLTTMRPRYTGRKRGMGREVVCTLDVRSQKILLTYIARGKSHWDRISDLYMGGWIGDK